MSARERTEQATQGAVRSATRLVAGVCLYIYYHSVPLTQEQLEVYNRIEAELLTAEDE